MEPHDYLEVDVALIKRRKQVKDMVIAINGETEFIYRGRSDDGKGIQELHLDFETEYYKVWVTFRRSGVVHVYRDTKTTYERRRWAMPFIEHDTMEQILAVA